jgi:hypothetical protein
LSKKRHNGNVRWFREWIKKEKTIWSLAVVIPTLIFIFVVYLIPDFNSSEIGFLLSTISNGLAAVFAITFSIMLIGGQMSSRLGIRLIDFIFTKTSFLYMFLFIFSIILPILILKNEELQIAHSSLMPNISLILAFICLILLPPYFYHMKRNFNPETVLKKQVDLFINEIEKLFIFKVYGRRILPESLDIIDTLIMLSLNEKDFVAFEKGLLYLRRLSMYTRILKYTYRIKSYEQYLYLNNVELEIERRINEITLACAGNIRACRSIISSLATYTIYLINALKTIKIGRNIKLIFSKNIEDVILRIKKECVVSPFFGENYFLKEESLYQLRKIEVELAKNEQGKLLMMLYEEVLLKSLENIYDSDEDNKKCMIDKILIEIYLLGAIINKWCKEQNAIAVLKRITKFFRKLEKVDKEKRNDILKQSKEIIDSEMPELSKIVVT